MTVAQVLKTEYKPVRSVLHHLFRHFIFKNTFLIARAKQAEPPSGAEHHGKCGAARENKGRSMNSKVVDWYLQNIYCKTFPFNDKLCIVTCVYSIKKYIKLPTEDKIVKWH